MKYLAMIALLGASAAFADERAPLYDTWGTPKQCEHVLLKPGGTVTAHPFEIRPGWLRHGDLWCRLNWFPATPRADGMFVSSRALCGEDSAQGFRLDMVLGADGLRLIWDERLVNGPMQRCSGS